MLIGLLGATGYTGRLVTAELSRRDLPHRLGARNRQRLDSLSAGTDDRVVVDTTDPSGLDRFLRGVDVLISTVGPFAELGMPVVEAAVRNGTAYVDSTGEVDFMSEVYGRFSGGTRPIVPACGFDYLPGDLAVAAAAAAAGGAVSIQVAYAIEGMTPSRGTVKSALGVVGSASPEDSSAFTVEFPDGPKSVVPLRWGESVTVPRHQPGARLQVGIVAPRAAAAVVRPAASALRRVAPFLAPLAARLPEGPGEERRRRSRATVVARVDGPGGRSESVVVEVSDVYGITARLLVQAALDVAGSGALTPAQALDPVPFLDSVSGEGFSWRRL